MCSVNIKSPFARAISMLAGGEHTFSSLMGEAVCMLMLAEEKQHENEPLLAADFKRYSIFEGSFFKVVGESIELIGPGAQAYWVSKQKAQKALAGSAKTPAKSLAATNREFQKVTQRLLSTTNHNPIPIPPKEKESPPKRKSTFQQPQIASEFEGEICELANSYPKKSGKERGKYQLRLQMHSREKLAEFAKANANYCAYLKNTGKKRQHMKGFDSFVGSLDTCRPWIEWIEPEDASLGLCERNLDGLDHYRAMLPLIFKAVSANLTISAFVDKSDAEWLSRSGLGYDFRNCSTHPSARASMLPRLRKAHEAFLNANAQKQSG